MAKKSTNPDVSKQSFISLFNSIASHKHRYSVFSDFVFMSGIALHNAIIKDEKLEKEYFEITARYSKEEETKFSKLLAEFIRLLNDKPIDVLGSLYMELELGNYNNGQFFTPPEISSLIAKVTYGDAISKINQPFITLSEPTCGAGGMVLAFVNEMISQGFNPAEKLFVQCIDIDRLAGFMCYVQLTLWNVPAEIIIGDSLSGKYREVYYTPAYYIGNWHNKLRLRQFSEAFKTLCQGDDKEQGDLEENKQQETENQQPMADAIVKNESTVETVINPKLKLNSDPQIDLFDFDIEH